MFVYTTNEHEVKRNFWLGVGIHKSGGRRLSLLLELVGRIENEGMSVFKLERVPRKYESGSRLCRQMCGSGYALPARTENLPGGYAPT